MSKSPATNDFGVPLPTVESYSHGSVADQVLAETADETSMMSSLETGKPVQVGGETVVPVQIDNPGATSGISNATVDLYSELSQEHANSSFDDQVGVSAYEQEGGAKRKKGRKSRKSKRKSARKPKRKTARKSKRKSARKPKRKSRKTRKSRK